jgi:K+-sensing histidine kinase KdpD
MNVDNELESLLHDLEIFNRDAARNLELITKDLNAKKDGNKLTLSVAQADSVRNKASALLDAVHLNSVRIKFYNLIKMSKNQVKLDMYKAAVGTTEIELYGKFHKAIIGKKIKQKQKKLAININQEDYVKQPIRVFAIAELIPFVLLDNAVKYSPKDSHIDITLIEKQSSIFVCIENQGPSIAPEKLSSITAAGKRGNNTDSFEGSGMGLYFVDKVCKESNIDLLIESDDEINYTYNGIDHSTFRASLHIPKKYG